VGRNAPKQLLQFYNYKFPFQPDISQTFISYFVNHGSKMTREARRKRRTQTSTYKTGETGLLNSRFVPNGVKVHAALTPIPKAKQILAKLNSLT
jgi:hypothetical protein